MKYQEHLSSIKPADQFFGNKKNRAKIQGNSDGFTIMEILIAICIFAIGILAVLTMQSRSFISTSDSKKLSSITEKGVSLLEHLISLPEDHAYLSGGTHANTSSTDFIDNNNNGTIDEQFEPGDITATWVVQDNVPLQETKTIEVTLTHTMGTQTQKSITIGGIKPSKF